MSFLRKLGRGSKSGTDRNIPKSKTYNEDSERPPSFQQFLEEKQKSQTQHDKFNSQHFIQPSKRSKLSQTLQECLGDPSSMGYFLQYLQIRKLQHLVKFYLDVESYRCSASDLEEGQSRAYTPAVSELSSPTAPCDATSAFINDNQEKANNNPDIVINSDLNTQRTGSISSTEMSSEHVINLSCDNSLYVGQCNADSFDSGFVKSDLESSKDVVSLDYNTDTDSIQSFHSISQEECVGKGGDKVDHMKANTEDAVKIYRRYIAPDSETPLSLPTEMKKDIVEEICAEFGLVSASCFDRAQAEVFRQMLTSYYPDYLCSQYHTKHQIDVLTGGNVNMNDVLYHDVALFNFMEFIEAEGVRHILEFWIAGKNFELSVSSVEQSSYSDVTHDAMILYDKYFSMQAKLPLGFGDDVRLEIENNICQELGPQIDCFERPLMMIVEYMELKYLNKFLNSKLFESFVKELITSVQTSQSQNGTNNNAADRYTSSESLHSTCSQQSVTNKQNRNQNTKSNNQVKNTLLATADLTSRLENVQIDLAADPDTIWKRDPEIGKIGEVDNLGRYHSYWEPPPDIKQEGGLLGAVKRLGAGGRSEQARLKEDMAWQVAEMFIQDVVTVTRDKQNVPD